MRKRIIEQYSTDKLRVMLDNVNKEIDELLRALHTSDQIDRLSMLRQSRIHIEREIGLREFNEISE